MSGRYVTSADLANMLRARINFETTQRDLAKEFGVSAGYLNDFLHGNRGAGPKILKALGYEETPFYRKRGEQPQGDGR